MGDLVIRSRRLVCPDSIVDGAVVVRDGRIVRIETATPSLPSDAVTIDAGNLAVLPGLVDAHVHVNEPGRTEWEGFATATRAAAASGVTTLVDMPLNSVPATTTRAALEVKRAAAAGQTMVDVAFWGGVVPGNAGELPGLHDAGVCGFKCFLSPSGVEEFAHVGEADLREAFPVLARLGAVLLAHAEWPPLLAPIPPGADVRRHQTWLASRPPQAEVAAIDLLIRLSREYGVRVHIVHVAAGEALPLIARAKEEGLALTAETCPHYLTFAAEDVPDGATAYKCAPPIRSRDNRERLWEALGAGVLDAVVTDHSPSPPAMKCLDTGDFTSAWGGIASIQLGLPVVWTGASDRGFSLIDLVGWMCEAPARLAGLGSRKGRIAAGCDADLVFFDPDAASIVDPSSLRFRHPLTPYAGRTLRGAVRTTLLRGEPIYDVRSSLDGRSGRLLR